MKTHITLDPSTLLAFCHIEKAAGTSLSHILRRIFFLRYVAVRPMHSRDNYYFTVRDLNTIIRFSPYLRGIGGHSVVPHGSLLHIMDRLRFITQVRDPVARAASQFRYWKTRMKLQTGPSSFLQHPASQNFQVKKIAGCEDLDLAKENISRYFLLAGTTERFDEFLVLLAHKLGMPLHLFTYTKQNVDRRADTLVIPKDFYDQLHERNRLDQRLYEWIHTELYSEYINAFSGDFFAALEHFRELQRAARQPLVKPVVDSLFRNAYWKPLSGLIRLSNGLPYHGSYATE